MTAKKASLLKRGVLKEVRSFKFLVSLRFSLVIELGTGVVTVYVTSNVRMQELQTTKLLQCFVGGIAVFNIYGVPVTVFVTGFSQRL